ncbi:hypothetical protein [Clostridium sp. ZS2-4]|uniref:hypothetical protein n=1 Tax=Clostridium sp. ZS2-4 TaxID=2987703 RepID=UPI00227A96BF|nr:hypothetical protein [Clostridium sp. ZS2-4]MCY6353964.1 hypothetical protein [Clostridium sp. ZS2-4]
MYQYSLNKIDTQIYEMVNEATKEGKVHGNKETNKINKDKKEDKKKEREESFQNKLSKHKVNQKITVDAVKGKNIKVEAFKEETGKNNISTGRFLNIKK